MDTPFSLEQLTVSDTVLLVAYGELDIAAASEVTSALRTHRSTATLVIVDLREVTFMDSSGLASLALNATDQNGQAPVQVIAPFSPQPARLLELGGLGHLFTSAEGLEVLSDLEPD